MLCLCVPVALRRAEGLGVAKKEEPLLPRTIADVEVNVIDPTKDSHGLTIVTAAQPDAAAWDDWSNEARNELTGGTETKEERKERYVNP